MRILHFSDTHLGYNDLDKVGKKGINIREQDFYDAFTFVINQAIKLKPDLIIHSGDFFNRPSPANRPMIFALEQLRRLEEANIPIVIIAGNHETPKTIYTSPILKALNTIKNIHPIFGQTYETVTFGDLVIHGMPHINDDQLLLVEMDKIQPISNKWNIILLHTSIGKSFIMEEFGEKLFPPERMELLNQFDYVALGHWHNFQKVSKLNTAWYSGSTERMGDTEAGKAKGFCLLNLEKGKAVVPEFIEIPTRNWYRIDIKKCSDLTVEDIENQLQVAVKTLDLQDAILSIYLHKIQSTQSILLTHRRILELFPAPLHIHVKRIFTDADYDTNPIHQQTKSTEELLDGFISKQIDDDAKAKKMINKAKYYFNLYESGEYRKR